MFLKSDEPVEITQGAETVLDDLLLTQHHVFAISKNIIWQAPIFKYS